MIVQDQWRYLMRLLELGGTPEEWTVKADVFLGLAINAADKVILPKKAMIFRPVIQDQTIF